MGKAFIGNFKGPKGDTGPQGAQGIQGIQGPAGPTGEVDADTPIEFTEATSLANIESGESISTIFGKTKKILGSLLIGAGSTLLGQNLAAARALVSDANGKIGTSPVTATELQYLSGVTKNIQAQFGELNGNITCRVFGDFAKMLSYYGINISKFSSLSQLNESLPINIHAITAVNTEYAAAPVADIMPAKYGILEILKGYNNGFCTFIFHEATNKKTWINKSRILNGVESLGGEWAVFATESYVDDKTKFFNFCSLDQLVSELGIKNTDNPYNFFNSNKLKTGFYFGSASGGLLKGMTTNTYNSYVLFKAQTNFGKLFVMPTSSSIIYMLDAQKSDTWYTLHQ